MNCLIEAKKGTAKDAEDAKEKKKKGIGVGWVEGEEASPLSINVRSPETQQM